MRDINFADYTLGKSDKLLTIASRQENADAALEMVRQCQTKLAIISRELDPFIYNQSDFVNAVKRLALNRKQANIRIIVFEPDLIIHRGHRLLDLARKLSSFISIRKPNSEFKTLNKAMLIADETAYISRENDARYNGKLTFKDRSKSKYMLAEFNTLWENSKPDPNLRRMSL